MINVAPLTAEDRPTWEALFAGYNAFYGRTWPAERYEYAWNEFQRGDRIHALGASLDGRLIGITHFLIHASTTSPDVCYLQDLFTAPEARGQGAGRSLIRAVEEWARGRRCARLYWHTQQHNETARRLYDQVAEYRDFIVYSMPIELR